VYRISKVFLTDGREIDFKDKNPGLKLNYKEKGNVIVYDDVDAKTSYIMLKDVNSIKIELYESNVLVSVLVIIGSVILFFTLLYIILGGMGKFSPGG
jgi:hypothetical protein